MSWWKQWLQQPQRLRLHASLFQLHYWVGAVAGAYLTLMSVTGSILVFRDQLSRWRSVEWLVRLHAKPPRRIGGPMGERHRRRRSDALVSDRRDHLVAGCEPLAAEFVSQLARQLPQDQLGFAQRIWLLVFSIRSALGISGIYFAFPQAFSIFFVLDSGDRITDQWLYWLSELHFGRFTRLTEALWAVLGLVPGFLAFPGTFVCCRRVIFKKPSNP